MERDGFERSVPRVRDNDFETVTFERLITFCAVTKGSEFPNPGYRPGTFLKIAGRTVGSAGRDIIVVPMRFVQDRH